MTNYATAWIALLLLMNAPVKSLAEESAIDQITSVAANSDCARYNWKDRGRSALAYPKGMAIVFATALCQPDRPDVLIVSAAVNKADPNVERKDALAWYEPQFAALGMKNDTAGRDTLRHAYSLLMGLGMRESSGEHCVGRDASADFTTGDSAEAG